jgi:hypothetical protein
VFHGKVPVIPTAVFSALAWAVAVFVATLPLLLGRVDRNASSGRIVSKIRSAAFVLGEGIRDTGRLLRSRRWRAILGAAGSARARSRRRTARR